MKTFIYYLCLIEFTRAPQLLRDVSITAHGISLITVHQMHQRGEDWIADGGIIRTGLPHHIHRYCLSTNLKKKTYLIISKTFEYLISVRSFRIGGCFNKRPKTRANRECLRPIKLCLVQLLLVFTYSACVSVTSMTFVNSTKRTFAHVFPEKKQLIMLTNKFIKPLIKISLVII